MSTYMLRNVDRVVLNQFRERCRLYHLKPEEVIASFMANAKVQYSITDDLLEIGALWKQPAVDGTTR